MYQSDASGSVEKAAAIENALGRAIPVLIGFLASLLGIGGLANKVKKRIGKLRKRIAKAIDKMIRKARKVFGKLVKKGKKGVKKGIAKVLNWWKAKRVFKAKDGTKHKIFYKGKGKKAILQVASNNPQSINSLIKSVSDKKSQMTKDQKAAFAALKPLNKNIENLENKLENKRSTNKQKDYNDLQEKINHAINHLSVLLPLVDGPKPPKAIMPAFTNGVRARPFEAMFITKDQPKQTPKGEPSTANNGKTLAGWLQLFNHTNPKTGKPIGANNAFEKTHLLHESLGGKARDSNLVSASNSVNKGFRPMDNAAKADIKSGKRLWHRISQLSFHPKTPNNGVKGIDYSGYPRTIRGEYGNIEYKNRTWSKTGPKGKLDLTNIPIPDFGTSVTYNLDQMSGRQIAKITDGKYTISTEMGEFIYKDRKPQKEETIEGKRKTWRENNPFTNWSTFLTRMATKKEKSRNVPSDYNKAIKLLTDLNNKGLIQF